MSESPAVRYRLVDRHTRSLASLDDQLPAEHAVRVLWHYVEQLDLSHFLRPHKAVVGHPGAPVLRPQVLFALWLFSLTEGSLSARELSRRCQRDLPYQWLCGGQTVNYHTLADFYAQNATALRQLFVEHVAILRQQELLDLHTVTLDGRKVVANASKDHYRREPTLQAHLDEAQAHLRQVEQTRDQPQVSAAQAKARQRAARERVERLERALEVVRQRQQQRRANDRRASVPEDARASETDPDCAKMKFPDGGYHLAYNVETVTDAGSGLIVTVGVTHQGSDNGQLGVMLDQVHDEQGVWPDQAVADAGFADLDDVERLEGVGVALVMPPKNATKEKAAGQDPYARKRRDSEAVAQWRQRMGTAAAQERYRCRAPVAEGVHAHQWQRGWQRLRLRGLRKVLTETLWQALGQNVAKLLKRGAWWTGTVRALPA